MRRQLTATFMLLAAAALGSSAAVAATKAECKQTQKTCTDRCKRVFETTDRREACYNRCDSTYIICLPTGSAGGSSHAPPKNGPVKPRRPYTVPIGSNSGGVLQNKGGIPRPGASSSPASSGVVTSGAASSGTPFFGKRIGGHIRRAAPVLR